jgi:tRNA pseudouridine38-40 synthase
MADTSDDTAKRAYRIAYDGRDYHGFQRQPDVATVSDAILDALRDLDVLAEDREVPPGYAAAGRTDAGVSAVAQTVAFEAPEWLTPAALNAELPADVRAWASATVPSAFHPTHDAAERVYTYYLHAPEASDERAATAATALSGRHDFHNLTPDDEGTIRELTVEVDRDGPILVLTVTAGGFPRQLVRRLVAVIEAVATGAASRDRVEQVLDAAPLDGPHGVAPAPPEPLVLSTVTYRDVSFAGDEDARASLAAVFAGRQARAAAAVRVYGDLADP